MKRHITSAVLAAAFLLGSAGTFPAEWESSSMTVAAAEQAANANPIISRGVPAYSDSGTASHGNDEVYYTAWSAGSGSYLAYDLSGVSEQERKQVIAVWYNTSTFDMVGSYVNKSAEPIDYVIEGNAAPGGSYPDNGWKVLDSVTGNGLSSRQHLLDLEGCNWIRIRVTKAEGDQVSLNFDIHSAVNGVRDSWIFIGDSITAGSMVNAYGTGFATYVNQFDGRYFPVQQNGGIGGITSKDGAEHIDGWLSVCPANYVSIAYGTNDAWGNPYNLDSYYTNTKYMIDAVLKAGKTPILPTIPYASDPDAGKYTAEYNAKVAQLYSEFGDKLLHGPDFYAFFQANSYLLGDDGVHPSSDGYEAMRKLWAETMYEAVYQNAASVPEEPVTVDPIRGDVNSDGVFDVTDVVLLQKWLLSVPDTHLADWKNGDFYEDDSLDVFDLALMKRSLVGDPVQETPHTQDFTALYEAEDGTCSGENSVMDDAAASGGKVVGNFADDADTLTFTVNIPSDGCYSLHFTAKGLGGEKSNNVSVDGENVGSFTSAADTYTSGTVRNVLMTAGTHKITIQKSWGWITVDSLEIKADEMISDSIYNVSDQLINPNADANTKALFSYLCDSYGKYTLSGQVCDYGLNGPEYQAIFEVTGEYPAICGLDFMNYATALSDRGIRGESVDTALQIHQAGGIVEFCWHWSAPAKYVKDGNDANGNPCWWQGFSTPNVTIDLDAVMNGRDPEGQALLDADIAAIAKQIKTLEDAGVPILWRPLHEASGGWFWWGASGADAYKKLWYHLYDQLTNVYGCNNLIWVWNGQSAEWYPGDDYVDIVGEDIYAGERNYAPQNAKFSEIAEYTGGRKIIALTENGTLPDIDKMVAANARWAWFGTWCGDFVVKNGVYSEQFTDREMLKKVYGSEYVITLDELPWNQ